MKPVYLEFCGINSFSETAVIDFGKLLSGGIFGIFGDTGSGKSTILDSIHFALYGKIERADGVDSINHHSEKSVVSFRFEILQRGKRVEYGVERERRRKNNVTKAQLYCVEDGKKMPLAEGMNDVNAKIEEILGLTFDDFKKCIALPQGEFASLVKAKNADRVKLVSRIFDLEKYGERLAIAIRTRHKQAESEAEVLAARMEENGFSGENLGEKESALAEKKERLKESAEALGRAESAWLEQKKRLEEKEEYERCLMEKRAAEVRLPRYLELREKLKVAPQAAELLQKAKAKETAKRSAAEWSSKQKLLEEKRALEEARLNSLKNRLKESGLDDQIERETVLLGKVESAEGDIAAYKQAKEKFDECVRAYKEADAKCPKEDFTALLKGLEEEISSLGELSFSEFVKEQMSGILLAETYREVRSDLLALQGKFPQTAEEVERLVQKYTLSNEGQNAVDAAAFKATFDERERRRKALVAKRDEVEKRKREYEDNEAKKERIKEQGAMYRKAYEEAKGKIEALGADRADMVKARVEQLKKLKADEEGKIKEKENGLSKISAEIAAASGQKEAFEKQAEDGKKAFISALEQSGFSSLFEAESLIKELGDTQKAKGDCDEFFAKMEALNLRLLAVDEKKISAVDEESVQKAKEKKLQAEEVRSGLLQEIAVGEKELADCKIKQKKHEELKKQYDEKEKERELWERLRSLTDKNRFMNFIAAEYLQEVCASASSTLLTLTSGRYYLKYDGEFKAADNLNGGTLRAVKTLSGGETFLVSLSLALSLAGAICSKSLRPIEFFFLDEGFGTLDEKLVDTVMDVLGKLSRSFSIGVISHVEELKHRIENKVVVTGANEKRGSQVTMEVFG